LEVWLKILEALLPWCGSLIFYPGSGHFSIPDPGSYIDIQAVYNEVDTSAASHVYEIHLRSHAG
jgi:hypothetical protein